MTGLLFYIWYLFAAPQGKLMCSIWLNRLPNSADYALACPMPAAELPNYQARMVEISSGDVLCNFPAENLFSFRCPTAGAFDTYRIEFFKPNFSPLVCSVKITHQGQPSAAEIADQCPDAPQEYRLEFGKTMEPETPVQCTLPAATQPTSPAELATAEKYYLLSGKLIWFGYSKPSCNGFSGLNSEGHANECGLASAQAESLAWQNQLDQAIYDAALESGVPAQYLKRLIGLETQFWPWTGTDGEHGLIQITEDGADTVMRVYVPGYDLMSAGQRTNARRAWLNSLDCSACTPREAMSHAAAMMPEYARALSAYYCAFGSWDEAIKKWNVKHEGRIN